MTTLTNVVVPNLGTIAVAVVEPKASSMNWMEFALKLPMVIAGVMSIVEKVKGAPGAAKKAAVIEAIPESVSLLEFSLGQDLLNDDSIKLLISAYIDAEAVALKARNALKAGILAKKPPTEV